MFQEQVQSRSTKGPVAAPRVWRLRNSFRWKSKKADEAVSQRAAPIDVIVIARKFPVVHSVAFGQKDIAKVAASLQYVSAPALEIDFEDASLNVKSEGKPRSSNELSGKPIRLGSVSASRFKTDRE